MSQSQSDMARRNKLSHCLFVATFFDGRGESSVRNVSPTAGSSRPNRRRTYSLAARALVESGLPFEARHISAIHFAVWVRGSRTEIRIGSPVFVQRQVGAFEVHDLFPRGACRQVVPKIRGTKRTKALLEADKPEGCGQTSVPRNSRIRLASSRDRFSAIELGAPPITRSRRRRGGPSRRRDGRGIRRWRECRN
jgi:hypothetical protein